MNRLHDSQLHDSQKPGLKQQNKVTDLRITFLSYCIWVKRLPSTLFLPKHWNPRSCFTVLVRFLLVITKSILVLGFGLNDWLAFVTKLLVIGHNCQSSTVSKGEKSSSHRLTRALRCENEVYVRNCAQRSALLPPRNSNQILNNEHERVFDHA